jgi:O-antigen/teichoic acid export membrane protein
VVLQLADAARRLKGLSGSADVAAIARVFGLKGAITVLSFALVTFAARALQPELFGTYSLLFSAAGLLGIAATLGQQVLVMRFWSEYLAAERDDLLKGALIFSATAALLGCVVLGVPFYLWCTAHYGDSVALAVVLYLVTFALVMTTAHLVRSAVGVGIGDGVANFLLTLPGAAYFGTCMVAGVPAELAVSFAAMAAGAALAIVVHLFVLRGSLASRPAFHKTRPAFLMRQWTSRSAKLWMSSALEAANQYLDVLVIGFLMDPVTAGAWFVLTRLANIISVATDAIHMFATRHIPQLYFRGETARLGGILDTVAWVVLLVILGSIVAIAIAGGWLLAIFNSSYAAYHGVLIILAIGAAAGAAAGSSPSLLMLTGHEGRYLAIIGGAVLLRLCALVTLVPMFGAAGAAVAVAASQLAMTLLIRRAVRHCTGIDASVLRVALKAAPSLLSAKQS